MPDLPAGALPLHPRWGHIPRSPSPQYDLLNPPLISLDEPRLHAPRPWKSAFTAARDDKTRTAAMRPFDKLLQPLANTVSLRLLFRGAGDDVVAVDDAAARRRRGGVCRLPASY